MSSSAGGSFYFEIMQNTAVCGCDFPAASRPFPQPSPFFPEAPRQLVFDVICTMLDPALRPSADFLAPLRASRCG